MDFVVFAAIVFLVATPLTLWVAGAMYFDVAHGAWWGWLLSAAWLAAVAAVFLLTPHLSQALLILLIAFALFYWWWRTIEPSHHRDWDPNFSQLPTIELAGDELVVTNVRNTEYRSIEDYTLHYETRRYRLSRLSGVDVLILYWGSRFMCHPMFVFDFGEIGRLCISLEVRYRRGQKYDFLKSLYRQQELMYVVSDERDAILRRTQCLVGHDMYLYHLRSRPLEDRQFLFEYANRINQLVEAPRWYHGITANCTTVIYAQGRGRIEWDWRMLLNGQLDRMLYDRRRLDHSLPFAKLKELSWVNDVANRAPQSGFGDSIRRELPGFYRGDSTANAADFKSHEDTHVQRSR